MKRRLSDKILDALQQALSQGRDEVAKRLELVHQAVQEEDEYLSNKRRSEDDDHGDD